MYLRDFQGNYVKHKDTNAKKDAVFSNFFNIEKLKSVTSSYGMEFINRIHILPGSKTVRLYGSIGHFKSTMKAQKKELDKSLRDRTNEFYQFLQDNDSVRGLKKAWKTNFEEQKQCYEKVEDAQERDKTSDLTKTWKAKVEENDERYRNVESPFTVGSNRCCRKVEECKLDEDMDRTTAVFSGTDNGIIKTTEIVFFEVDRFAPHLKLYNRFQILGM
ncbi:hypothetical protein BD408DRAFT_414298 [Parasitella parasitica]|nr:hypothetical protein BD408DRAFT_414298 [Parasitella parasitica]